MGFLNGMVAQRSLPEPKQIIIIILSLGIGLSGGMVAAQEPLLALVAILAALLAVVMISWPEMATLTVVFLIYSNAAAVAVRFHGVPYIVGAAFPLLLIVPLGVYLIFRRQKIIVTPPLPLIILFLLIQLLSALFSIDVGTAAGNALAFVLEGLLLYFLITNVIRTPTTLRLVIWTLLLAGVVLAGIPLFQQVTGTFDNNYGGFAQFSDTGFRTGEESLQGEVRQFRLAGAIGEQNRFAQILLMLVPLGLFQFMGERSKILRLLALLATALIALGVTLAFSRGAAVAFFLMLVIMIFMRIIKPYQFFLLILGVYLLMLAVPQYSTRLLSLEGVTALFAEDTSDADGALKGRATVMLAAVHVFADHPLIGVGPGMFKYYSAEYGEAVGLRVLEGTRQAHSLYLAIAADTGAFGLACFMTILFVILRSLLRTRQYWEHRRPELSHMATGLFLTIIAYMTTGLFLHLSYMRYFWLMLAIASAAGYVAEELKTAKPDTASVILPSQRSNG